MQKQTADRTLPLTMSYRVDGIDTTCKSSPATRPCGGRFVLAVVLVFLVLAAQYESWSLPLAVILVVPMCLLCSVTGVALTNMDVDFFSQMGFVVLVGLPGRMRF